MVRVFGFANRLPGWVSRSFRAIAAPLLRPFTSPKYAGLLEYGGSYEGAYLLRRGLFMPWELPAVLGREVAREGWERLQSIPSLRATRNELREDRSIVACQELAWYMRGQLLRDADWAGMAHSVEIRVPFLDVDVLRAAAPLVAAGAIRSKRDFAALAALKLPPVVVDKPKSGFLVPVRDWLSEYSPRANAERRLRGWARRLSRHFTARRSYFYLLTEAYGGHGGIALYNRDLLSAVCTDPMTHEVVAIPRLMGDHDEALPPKLRFDTSGLTGKLRFFSAVLRTLRDGKRFDAVICGHINLLPVAVLSAILARAPLTLLAFGIDAWRPTSSRLVNALIRRADAVIAISDVTLERLLRWSGLPRQRCSVLPNAIHLEQYGAGPKNSALLARYGLESRKVIMTLGRLSADERYKGIDEVLDVMPRLIAKLPDLVYLIVGDGSDRARLERKVPALGLQGHVVFSGQVRRGGEGRPLPARGCVRDAESRRGFRVRVSGSTCLRRAGGRQQG